MYDIEKLRELLTTEEYRIVDDYGKVLFPSAKIYERIAEVMGGNPSAKHVYTIAKENRNGMYDAILSSFGLSTSLVTDKNISFDTNISDVSKIKENFILKFSRKDWKSMKQKDVVYEDGRKYTVFLPGWTDVFANNIWMQHRIPCPWAFKTAKYSQSENKSYYCRIRGNCGECQSKLICTLPSKPANDEEISFKCVIKNSTPGYVHVKRRQLRGERRLLVANTLVNTKTDAITFVRDQAKNLIDFGDPYPPILPKTTVLRKAVNEVKDKRLGLVGSKSIGNIINMKDTTHVGSIIKIGASPFFCHYWTKEQKLLYKLHYKNYSESFMAIDATGSVTKRIKYPYSKSSHIFLYQCMSVSNVHSVPVFQMLSAEQDTVAITTWLLKIISSGIPVPRVVVCDFSQALLMSISIAFAHKQNLRDYMQNCYEVIFGKSKSLPATYIRLDISHLVAIICRWECLKRHTSPKVRQFFVRAICQAYKMHTLREVEYLLESLLIVSMSENIGQMHGKNLESQTRYVYVSNVIKGVDINEYDEIGEHILLDEINLENNCHTGWLEWSKIIYERASVSVTNCTVGDNLNAFYNTEIAYKLQKFMCYLPIWTNIMSPLFKITTAIATSSSVEAEFANLKTRVFKNELPLRVDKFLMRHIEYIDGRIKEASAHDYCKIKNDTKKSNDIKNSNIDITVPSDSVNLNIYENWKGLGNSPKPKKKKPNYLDTCLDWDYVQSHNTVQIPILKNGNLCESTRVDGAYVFVKETCAFDSIVQIISHAIAKDCNYKKNIENFDHPIIKLALNILRCGKVTASDYSIRAQILLNVGIFQKTSTRHIEFVNSNCNAAHLIDMIFYQMPTLKRIKTCDGCDYVQARHFATLHINIGLLIDKGLGEIQQAINDTKMDDKTYTDVCTKCRGTVSMKTEHGPHVFLDTSLITDPNYNNGKQFVSTLDTITKLININNYNYTLCGVIHYIHYGSNPEKHRTEGHYVAITYTGLHWYEYDDLQKTRNFVSPNKIITPHSIMYIK